MASDKPAVLLICGGWHTPETYQKLIKSLRAAGHDVHCLRNPSTRQERPPKASLAEDSANIREYVTKLVSEGRRVVALGHSYGGQVMTNSLLGLGLESRKEQGLKGGVSDLVYLAAFALAEGGSMIGKVKEMGHEALMPLAFDFAEDMTVLARDPKGQLVGEWADQEELDTYVGQMVLWNGQCMYDAIEKCAWREIRVTYIYALNDMTVPLDYQKSMVANVEEATGKPIKLHEIESGHCPNFTAPEAIVSIINKVVA